MKRILFIISLSLILFACDEKEVYQSEERIGWSDFETITLSGKELCFDEDIMDPYHLIVKDSFLITINRQTEKLCHVFNLNKKMKVCEQIVMGQGPDDMIHPFFVDTEDSLTMYAPMTSTVFTFMIEDFVKNSKVSAVSRSKLGESGFFSELSVLGGKMIGFSSRPDALCYLFDSDGSKIGDLGQYPVGPNYSDLEKVDAYRLMVTTNKKDRVALCYMFTDLIDFYDVEGNLKKRLHGPDYFNTSFMEFNDGVRVGSYPNGDYYRDAFYSPVGTKDYLFVLYNGKFVNRPNYDLLAKNILVFDWEGNPIYNYQIDKGVSRITIDAENRKIYGISDTPEYHIVEFSY